MTPPRGSRVPGFPGSRVRQSVTATLTAINPADVPDALSQFSGSVGAPFVRDRTYSRRSWTTQLNHTAVLAPNLLNEARIAYLNGDPITLWESQALSTTYTRSGSVPFTIGESRSADLFGHQAQLSDALSWSRGRHDLF